MSFHCFFFGILCLSCIAFVHATEEESADVNFYGDSITFNEPFLDQSQTNDQNSNCENLKTELGLLTQQLQGIRHLMMIKSYLFIQPSYEKKIMLKTLMLNSINLI